MSSDDGKFFGRVHKAVKLVNKPLQNYSVKEIWRFRKVYTVAAMNTDHQSIY